MHANLSFKNLINKPSAWGRAHKITLENLQAITTQLKGFITIYFSTIKLPLNDIPSVQSLSSGAGYGFCLVNIKTFEDTGFRTYGLITCKYHNYEFYGHCYKNILQQKKKKKDNTC